MTVKILHISDLHVTGDPAANKIVEQKIGFIKKNYPQHHYVITGDIVDNEGKVLPGTQVPLGTLDPMAWGSVLASPPPPVGSIGPHLEVARRSMGEAMRIISQLDIDRVFICAGNHDLGLAGNFYYPELVEAFDDLLWQPIMGNKAIAVLDPIAPLVLPHPSAHVPVVFTLTAGPASVQLVMLNTAGADENAPAFSFASGRVGKEQLKALETFLTPEKIARRDGVPPLRHTLGFVRIIALHHHPWFHAAAKSMDDADKFFGVMSFVTDAVLFGHRHVQRTYSPTLWDINTLTLGGFASGWIRSENTATEIVVESPSSVGASYKPIA